VTRPAFRPDGIPTRRDARYWTPAEYAIHKAIAEIEKMGASTELTSAITYLNDALELVADQAESE
jgi:hypothetical protein